MTASKCPKIISWRLASLGATLVWLRGEPATAKLHRPLAAASVSAIRRSAVSWSSWEPKELAASVS